MLALTKLQRLSEGEAKWFKKYVNKNEYIDRGSLALCLIAALGTYSSSLSILTALNIFLIFIFP